MLLLHHYTATAFAVLDQHPSPVTQRLWQDNVVRIGLQYPFLLRGILAISAAHLAHLYPGTNDKHLLQSSTHINIALREFQSQLVHLGDDPVLPLFPLACLLVIHNFAAVKLRESDYIDAFLSSVQLVKGVGIVLRARWDVFENCELSPLIAAGIMQDIDTEVLEFVHLREKVCQCMHGAPEVERAACLTAIHDLQVVYSSIRERKQGKSALAILLNWPLKLPTRFVDMVSERHPVALVILAHLVVVLQPVGHVWWLSAWDAKLLENIMAHLDGEYHAWLTWAMSCVRYEHEHDAT